MSVKSTSSTAMTSSASSSSSSSTSKSSHHSHRRHPKHSNIGKNPNPVLVMTPADQKASSALVLANFPELVQSSTDLPSSSTDQNDSASKCGIRFGNILVKPNSGSGCIIDYSQIANLHKNAAASSKPTSPNSSQSSAAAAKISTPPKKETPPSEQQQPSLRNPPPAPPSSQPTPSSSASLRGGEETPTITAAAHLPPKNSPPQEPAPSQTINAPPQPSSDAVIHHPHPHPHHQPNSAPFAAPHHPSAAMYFAAAPPANATGPASEQAALGPRMMMPPNAAGPEMIFGTPLPGTFYSPHGPPPPPHPHFHPFYAHPHHPHHPYAAAAGHPHPHHLPPHPMMMAPGNAQFAAQLPPPHPPSAFANRPPPPSMAVAAVAPPPFVPKPRKILDIFDPDTGKNVINEFEEEKKKSSQETTNAILSNINNQNEIVVQKKSSSEEQEHQENVHSKSHSHEDINQSVESQLQEAISKVSLEDSPSASVSSSQATAIPTEASSGFAEVEVEIIVDSPQTAAAASIHSPPILEDNSAISYPSCIPQSCIPSIRKSQRRCYSIAFLKLFANLCDTLPPGIANGEFLTTFSGPMSVNYLASSSTSHHHHSGGSANHHGSSSQRSSTSSRRSSDFSSSADQSHSSRNASKTGSRSSKGASSNRPSSGSDKRSSSNVAAAAGIHSSSSSAQSLSNPLSVIHTSENSWSKATRNQAPSDEETATKKKFIGILNKLSREHFEELYSQIKALSFPNTALYAEIIGKIYDKAVDESAFAEMYARLVQRLSEDFVTFQDTDTAIVAKSGSVTRSLLLGRCQTEWKKRSIWALPTWSQVIEAAGLDLSANPSPIDKPEDMSLEAYWRSKLKKRSLGNVKFVGELYKLGVIHENIILSCIHGLLEAPAAAAVPGDEELECLARLLTTTGHRLDCEKLKTFIDGFFGQIQALAADSSNSISSRVRFMLLDLLDLRAARWNSALAKKSQLQSSSSQTLGKRTASAVKKSQSLSGPKKGGNESSSNAALSLNSQSKYSLLAEGGEEEEEGEEISHSIQKSTSSPLKESSSFPEWDPEQGPRLIHGCLREFLFTHRDPSEIIAAIRERELPWDPRATLREICKQTLETGKQADSDQLVALLSSLRHEADLADAVNEGVKFALDQLDDIVIDAPHARAVAEKIERAMKKE